MPNTQPDQIQGAPDIEVTTSGRNWLSVIRGEIRNALPSLNNAEQDKRTEMLFEALMKEGDRSSVANTQRWIKEQVRFFEG